MNLLDFMFPKSCIFCKKYGNYICDNCFKSLNNKYSFEKVHNKYYDYIVCSSNYKGIIRATMHNFKFHEKAYLYSFFVELLYKNKEICKFLKRFDFITFVPMTKNKKAVRGYNQSELLAKELGKKLDIQVIDLVCKTKENKTQSTLLKNEREINVKNIFDIYDNIEIKHKNILLVDDIVTTGSTVNAISEKLKKNGVNNICIIAFSKVL